MKSNDISKTVKITKAGMFNGFEGKIVSIKAQIDFGQLGIWGFDFSDIEELATKVNEAKIKPQEATSTTEVIKDKPKETKVVKTPKKAIDKKKDATKTKRPYVRKDKAV